MRETWWRNGSLTGLGHQSDFPLCLVQAITRHTCPDPHLGSWNCLPHQALIALTEPMSSIDSQGSSLGSFPTSPPFIATLIGLRAFDLVSSRVWWEATTNKQSDFPLYCVYFRTDNIEKDMYPIIPPSICGGNNTTTPSLRVGWGLNNRRNPEQRNQTNPHVETNSIWAFSPCESCYIFFFDKFIIFSTKNTNTLCYD